jgi:hypothetical protein
METNVCRLARRHLLDGCNVCSLLTVVDEPYAEAVSIVVEDAVDRGIV